ncbi:tRNA (adenine(22)-N(1))-methyltransferase [Halopseudomonas phragmitis]|uniref:SAM-dependent methyltransferase n=1 Tax=Halopseudomonas phragmitis TaxID=1931241 RepID=A0A1V0B5W6_9GAMM|nr:tRNA (adenine(22)-N(1))-methyltransferase TrmK [Halopseudomonas phragmitis]AQZ95317.1 SAM-dependent methyltransferase [Halopseudomonas phragmitis]
MKLSKRLNQIRSMVPPGYTHIWDCCCDHGLLGAALLSDQAAPHIHFVDVLPRLINQLNEKLQRFYPVTSNNWYTHCLDTAALPLEHYPGKHLIIIAGVGGDLTTRFIQAIHHQHPRAQLDFLLCPIHQEYPLRQQLIALDFRLKEEVLVSENQRFYEVLLVSAEQKEMAEWQKISPVGDKIWQADTLKQESIARRYLHKTLKHYQNSQKGNADNVRKAIDAYRAVTISKLEEIGVTEIGSDENIPASLN